jgi:hypothetical protein
VKDPPYASAYYGYREESIKQRIRGKIGEGHPKTLRGKQ